MIAFGCFIYNYLHELLLEKGKKTFLWRMGDARLIQQALFISDFPQLLPLLIPPQTPPIALGVEPGVSQVSAGRQRQCSSAVHGAESSYQAL